MTPSSTHVSVGDRVTVHLALPGGMPAGYYTMVMSVSDPTYPTFTYLTVTP